jgi:hypothetical protein
MKLKDLLSKIGRDYFYLMHLAYDSREREHLWEYALSKKLIGLDNYEPNINKRWSEVPERVKVKLSSGWNGWRRQFELFCEEMIVGDCVLVTEGETHLLGVGVVDGPCSFKKELSDEFFRHVCPVTWLQTYKRSIPFHVDNFSNTICRIDSSSRRWYLMNRELQIKTINPRLVRRIKDTIRKYENETYSEGGLKEIQAEVSVRDPRLVRAARDKYGTKCKVCGFDFEKKYGELGQGFIEVHHRKPLSKLKRKTPIKIKDVTVVCSNCHRMVHRKRPPISPDKLRSMIRKK